MGSISAMNSINRVLEKHGAELRQELVEQFNAPLRALLAHVDLDNATYGIKVTYRFKDDSWVDGLLLDIDELGERFPDCEVGY
jgi:hypothetical protein